MSAEFEEKVLEKLGHIDNRLDKIERTQDDTFEHLRNFELFAILKLQEHDERFNKIDQKFEEVDQRFKEIDQRFEQIDQRFEQIDQRFEEVGQRFKEIDQRFEEVDQRFEKFDQNFKEVNKSFKEINQTLKRHEVEIKKMSQDMQVTKEAVILMEQKISLEIPALFDGYSMHQEKQERQDDEINSLNLKVEKHDARISYLEEKVI